MTLVPNDRSPRMTAMTRSSPNRRSPRARSDGDLESRIQALEWERLDATLDERGHATTGPLLTPAECEALIAGYDEEARFRSQVIMARHGFGRGEYKYFGYPLPEAVSVLRGALYRQLAPLANRWQAALGAAADYPSTHEAYLERCHEAGQRRPTPLLLKYGAGDYNCLHQDLYGDLAFPLQVAFLLSAPGQDFTGGEFMLTEQRPRQQSRGEVVSLTQGEGVIFAVNHRPVQGKRGVYRSAMRHGVSRLKSGRRFTLGIIFHDAR